MNERIKEIMLQVTVDTLEKLAFMFAQPEDGGPEDSTGSGTKAGVAFEGPFGGALMMSVSEEVLRELSANMLGVDDEETTRDQRHDALKETMNILCGNLLPVIAGKEAVFDIGTPKIEGEEGFPETPGDPGSESAVSLNIDDERCNLRLFLKGEVPRDIQGRDA